MKNTNKRKNVAYAIVAILLTAGIVGGLTYAYFVNEVSDSKSIDAKIKSRSVDTQIFDVDDYLHIYADADNFSDAANIKNLNDMTKARISVRANNASSAVEKDYYVYLKVDQNSFDYTTDTKTPEMLLNVFGPNSEYLELTDEQLETIYGDVTTTSDGYEFEQTYTYDSTKNYDTITIAHDGYYKIEAWGASGGEGYYSSTGYDCAGGSGAYTSGVVRLEENDLLYLYPGKKGISTSEDSSQYLTGGYNGGGNGGYGGSDDRAGSGGGASDVRYFGEYTPTAEDLLWNSTKGLNSRVMVAAGGGGGSCVNTTNQDMTYRAGSGLSNISASVRAFNQYCTLTEINQTTGNFGAGLSAPNSEVGHAPGGAGGGWYGGSYCTVSNVYTGGQGGTSYISGHTGSVAVTSITDSSPKSSCLTGSTSTACSVSPSNLSFLSTVMIDGKGYNWTTSKGSLKAMPNPSGDYYASGIGHTGNGTIKVTYCGQSEAECTFTDKSHNLSDIIEAAMKNNGDIEEVLNLVDSNGNSLVDKFIQGDLFGLEYRTVVDKNGKTISGFDITNFRGILPITSNYRISTNDVNTPKEETWRAVITLVNLPDDQEANENKLLEGNLIITPNPALVQMTDDTTITTNQGVQEVQGDVIPLEDLCVYPEADDEAPDREKYMSIEDCVTRFVYRGQGVNGMYLHNGGRHDAYQNSDLEEPSFTLRYAGGNDVVANYVCFGYPNNFDVEDCKDSTKNANYLYRIIGFFYREVTYTYRYGGSSYERTVPEWNVKLIKNQSLGNIRRDQFNWNAYSLSEDWRQMIENKFPYREGGANYKTALTTYTAEGSYYSVDSYYRLMNTSDYAYAAIPYYWRAENSWENALEQYKRAVDTHDNWLYIGNETTNYSYGQIYNGGNLANYYSTSMAHRPTFLLKHGTLYRGGTGTASDPYILSYAQSYKSGAGTAANPYIPIDELVY